VEQLAAKADVKARARAKAGELAGQAKTGLAQARAKAAGRTANARSQVAGKTMAARQKAAAAAGTGRTQLQARVTPVWEAAPQPFRRAVAKGAGTAQQRRVPLAAALAVLIVCYVAARRSRKR
jgi:hypothetical protein